MKKIVDKWKLVKMTTVKKDGIRVYRAYVCPKCNNDVLVKSRYCPNCGKRLIKGIMKNEE